MTEQNPYAALLAGLEAKRDELTSAINVLRREMGLISDEVLPTGATSSGTSNGGSGDLPTEIRSDTFFGMKIPDAIKLYLRMAKRPQRASVIAKALTDGGLQYTSKTFLNTVQTSLSRLRASGDLVKLPNGWGLSEWYPGRTFDKADKPPAKRKKITKARPVATDGRPRKTASPKAKSAPIGVEKESTSA